MEIDAETADAVDAIGAIGDLRLAILSRAYGREDRPDKRLDLVAVERGVGESLDLTVVADGGSEAVDEQKVAASAAKKFFEMGR
jgi:hypothetical protein